MYIKEVLVSELQVGMKVASDVYWKSNNPYVLKDAILDQITIQRLDNMGVLSIAIEFEEEEQTQARESEYDSEYDMEYEKETKQFINTFDNTLETMNHLFDQVKAGKPPDVDLVKENAKDVVDKIMGNNNILGRLRLIESKDENTYKHSVNVAMLSTMIGKWLKMSEEDIYNLGCAGLLHDIGKAQIDEEILNKKENFSEKEFEQIKNHTFNGYRLLTDLVGLNQGIVKAALSHHECYDGTGYPLSLQGQAIHIYARIVAVADVYDAMTSDQINGSKASPFKVAEEIAASSFGKLDPHISRVFLDNIYAFFVGNRVELSNGVIGEIVYVNPQYPTRPLVRTDEGFVDLTTERHLEVADILSCK